MTIETQHDIDGLKHIGRIVGHAAKEMERQARPGMTTAELDAIGREWLERHGAASAPQSTYGFPGVTCISVNEETAHGIPGNRVIQPGDVVNVDVSAECNGYVADTGRTFLVPPSTPTKERLIAAARQALHAAIEKTVAGRPLNGIGKAIERVAKQKGFKLIRDLGGHGVGRRLHEEPGFIPGYWEPRDRRRLWEGLVIAIEPFLSTGAEHIEEAEDGWTLRGPRGNLTAQFEHTVIVTRGRPLLVTAV